MTTIRRKEITGRHVLIGLGAFFGAMLIANAIFVYFALSTFQGLDNPNAYEDGLNYNKRIAAAEEQAALGWSHEVSADSAGLIVIAITDEAGSAVTGLSVNGEIGRPVGADGRDPLAFREDAAGIYKARLRAPDPGSWIISANAADGASANARPVYRIKERLWLKPNS